MDVVQRTQLSSITDHRVLDIHIYMPGDPLASDFFCKTYSLQNDNQIDAEVCQYYSIMLATVLHPASDHA